MLGLTTPGASSVNWLMSRLAMGREETALASSTVPTSVEAVCSSGGASVDADRLAHLADLQMKVHAGHLVQDEGKSAARLGGKSLRLGFDRDVAHRDLRELIEPGAAGLGLQVVPRSTSRTVTVALATADPDSRRWQPESRLFDESASLRSPPEWVQVRHVVVFFGIAIPCG
jgi:hypothetical protein